MTEITKSILVDPASVDMLFDEAKRMTVDYIDNMQRAQQQAEYIIATVYVNIGSSTFDTVATLKWMDEEIKKLNEIKK